MRTVTGLLDELDDCTVDTERRLAALGTRSHHSTRVAATPHNTAAHPQAGAPRLQCFLRKASILYFFLSAVLALFVFVQNTRVSQRV